MVVFIIYIQGALAHPAEGNAIVSCHAQCPAFFIAVQSVEVKAGDIHVLRFSRHIEQLQDSDALPGLPGANPASLAGDIKFFEPLMPEAANHS